jgi:hypothetical protein
LGEGHSRQCVGRTSTPQYKTRGIRPIISAVRREAHDKAELCAQLEAALANYNGPVTRCAPGSSANEDPDQREQRKFDLALWQIARLQASQRREAIALKSHSEETQVLQESPRGRMA